MFRFMVFITATALMTHMAYANKLDPKWAVSREQANSLGDAAKAGDEAALVQLQEMVKGGQAAALHNLGWLNQYGFADGAVDYDASCDYYAQASALGYPPSMHGYALCLYGQGRIAKEAGAEDWEDLEYKADLLMLDAAAAGWVRSALYVSEWLLNRFDFSVDHAVAASAAVENGLKSNPNETEITSLTYIKAMAIIYGPKPRDFKASDAALHYADEKGHTAAIKAMPLLYSEWGKKIARQIYEWEPIPISAQDCYIKVKDPFVKLSQLEICNSAYTLTALGLAVLQSNVDYLHNHLTDLLKLSNDRLAIQSNKDLEWQIELLNEKKQDFLQAADIIDEKFMPLYRERVKLEE